jgi:UDP-N-acetylmuramoyl-tripeptide--D-alanyl-D-alanine ligase
VPDTLAAYGELAGWYARLHSLSRVIAVAGSNGKTTTRTLTHAVLSTAGETLQNEANENNLVGVPKTLLSITPQHRFAVVEIGTNQPGEILRLSAILRPDAAIITNIAEEHLEGLGGMQGVFDEESSVLTQLPSGGVGILNGDDPWSELARNRTARETVTFGFGRRCHVRASDWSPTPSGSVFQVNGMHEFRLKLPGRHNVMNALSAIAAGWVCGLPVESMQSAIARVTPVRMRSELQDIAGAGVLVDCYNANPGSVRAALEALDSLPQRRQRILCLGDMLEMGVHAGPLHLGLADSVVAAKPDLAVLVGQHMRALGDELESRGVVVLHFGTSEEAAPTVAAEVRSGDLVLVKGSRGMRMERIVEAIRDRSNIAPSIAKVAA